MVVTVSKVRVQIHEHVFWWYLNILAYIYILLNTDFFLQLIWKSTGALFKFFSQTSYHTSTCINVAFLTSPRLKLPEQSMVLLRVVARVRLAKDLPPSAGSSGSLDTHMQYLTLPSSNVTRFSWNIIPAKTFSYILITINKCYTTSLYG